MYRLLWTTLPLLVAAALGCGKVDVVADAMDSSDAANQVDGATGEAVIAADKTDHDFGTVLTGVTSATASVEVSNTGDEDTGTIAVSIGGGNAGDFAITDDACNGSSLAPAERCTLLFTFSPGAVGARAGTLTISASPGGSANVGLSGTGADQGDLSVSPSAGPFGDIVVGGASGEITFTVSNTGDGATGPIGVGITGTDAADFRITSDPCTDTSLNSGATCDVLVAFAPGSAGVKAASLTVMANPGGTAVSALSGHGLAPAALSIAPPSHNFDDALVGGASSPQVFTVTNDGDQPSGAITTSVSGGTTQFAVGADTCNGQTLTGGANCTISVTFTPTSSGGKSATLQVAATPGGNATSALSGNGQDPAILGASASSHNYGLIEVNQTSGSLTWTITNSGDVPSGTLSLSNSNGAEFPVTNGCTGTLAGGASCDVTVSFRPNDGGARTGSIGVSASPGGSVALAASGTGGWRLTVSRSGTGTVTSTDGEITCGGDCFGVYAPGSDVTLQGRTTNGSNHYFQGFVGGGCTAPARDCTVTVNAAMTVRALFEFMTNNPIFVSSVAFPSNLGSAKKYDVECNTLATAAGINTATKDGFIAFVSDSSSLAVTRLGSAVGWRRIDGKGFADSQDDLFTAEQIFHPVRYDENGGKTPSQTVRTGTNRDGTLAAGTCTDWTGVGSMSGGHSAGGPHAWASNTGTSCGSQVRVVCMGITRTKQMTPTTRMGKMIYLSSFYGPGLETPDARCKLDIPADVALVKAMVATTTTPASSVLDPTQLYVRPDGVAVGTGAEIAAMNLRSGMWQLSTGAYAGSTLRVWTGHTDLNNPGTTASTCSSWTSNSAGSSGRVGWPNTTHTWYWTFTNLVCSNASMGRLYCVEQ